MTYRACYWQSEDEQSELVLTLPEDADKSDSNLLVLAVAEAQKVDMLPPAVSGSAIADFRERLIIGDWTA